jgi:hypothetical protein
MMTAILFIIILIVLTILGEDEMTLLDKNVKLKFQVSLHMKVYSFMWFFILYSLLLQPELQVCTCCVSDIERTCSTDSSVL